MSLSGDWPTESGIFWGYNLQSWSGQRLFLHARVVLQYLKAVTGNILDSRLPPWLIVANHFGWAPGGEMYLRRRHDLFGIRPCSQTIVSISSTLLVEICIVARLCWSVGPPGSQTATWCPRLENYCFWVYITNIKLHDPLNYHERNAFNSLKHGVVTFLENTPPLISKEIGRLNYCAIFMAMDFLRHWNIRSLFLVRSGLQTFSRQSTLCDQHRSFSKHKSTSLDEKKLFDGRDLEICMFYRSLDLRICKPLDQPLDFLTYRAKCRRLNSPGEFPDRAALKLLASGAKPSRKSV